MGSVQEALGSLTEVYGQFAYLYLNTNPIKLSLMLGDNFYYGLADTNAVYMLTVDF
jgi:hypothetical protein